ncbi:carbamoyl-phosphate synthase large subunit [Gelria sp. Kuro-4]|uniref:carbamoyl-phosphate synthase large subunit n=1 Tax=Gelria sp. Kuro-4 TaxID=2796927 RepID=UPI001BED95B8|nr:carbamoyl-phosphate synthase large subunit [Gelria sp. Kuro-4]BCV25169.1 carbamoyl-phosphate synthase (glutamine-hydrolyzing) [Gelria sp. Kuro-4]
MPKQPEIRKVLVLGSGPVVIGQAAEFDYSGSQACRALREEGIEVVLVNPNPATIMTDPEVGGRVYLEPLQPEFVAAVIAQERPDGLLPTLGGQTGLNLAVSLAEQGVLARYGVRLLGTPLETIRRAEDRELFKRTMLALGEPVPESLAVSDLEAARAFALRVGLPLVVRPAFTLGGTGGGIAATLEQLEEVVGRGLTASPVHQVLLEKSLGGWKEIEFEVLRDGADNAVAVCAMENLDPMGVHTGDSVVVAPTQTLRDEEYQLLRKAALRIIRALGIEGGCNVQFALDPASSSYYVIEVNPRVSRSSALASKATGYPIAKVAAKIALGCTLPELANSVTGVTSAAFEPALDYVVVKFPSWPFDKFPLADRYLGTQMKATGEAMALARTFPAALLKAVRSTGLKTAGLVLPALAAWSEAQLREAISRATDFRLFALDEALRRGLSPDTLREWSGIDPWFLAELSRIAEVENKLSAAGPKLTADLLFKAKRLGFSDADIAHLSRCREEQVAELRLQTGLRPVYRTVDTCAAEFPARTPYYYSDCAGSEDEAPPLPEPAAVVLGAGPIRIGQGIEFDYSSVKAVEALREEGYTSIIINNNPETVSTDCDVSDRLYFEPLTPEDVKNVLAKENPAAVFTQFGGQVSIKLGAALAQAGYPLCGSGQETIDLAEDRRRFRALLAELGIPQPAGGTARTPDEARAVAAALGYPLLLRPSYVLGGQAMQIVEGEEELETYARWAFAASPGEPVLIDRYLPGIELEVDAVTDGTNVLIPGILRHIERAGIHSGDSIAVYPAPDLSAAQAATILRYTELLSRGLRARGLINVQFVLHEECVYVIEANPRASRTVPFLSKVTGIPLVKSAVQVSLGRRLAELGYGTGIAPARQHVAVKLPIFSTHKLPGVEAALGPEMRSTGEVLGLGLDLPTALWRGFLAAGLKLPRAGTVLASIADRDKEEALPYLADLAQRGFRLSATQGTADFLARHGVTSRKVLKIREGTPNLLTHLRAGEVDLVVNTTTQGQDARRDGFLIRRAAIESGIPCFTSLDTLRAYILALEAAPASRPDVRALNDYLAAAGTRGA